MTGANDHCGFCFEPLHEHTVSERQGCIADLREVEEIDMDEEAGDDVVIF